MTDSGESDPAYSGRAEPQRSGRAEPPQAVGAEPPRSGSGAARRWGFLAAAIALEVAGSLSLKGALTVPALYLVVGIGYAGAFLFLALTLRARMPLGVAYGIWGAAGVVLTAVLSAMIFGEPLTPLMGLGIAIIIAGVLCVELGSGRARAGSGEER